MLTLVPDSVVLMVGVPFVKVSVNVHVTPGPCARLIVAVPPDVEAAGAHDNPVNCQLVGKLDSVSVYVPAKSGPVRRVLVGLTPLSWKMSPVKVPVGPPCTLKLK